MKNVVTFETAQRLKEAGFPQPEPEAGQVWYSWGTPEKMIILTLSSQRNPRLAGRFDYVFFGSRAIHSDCFLDTEMPFAPTATDILAELGPYSLVSQGDWIVSKWVKDESGALTIVEKRFFAANPAEATAKAWLAIHEKKDLEK